MDEENKKVNNMKENGFNIASLILGIIEMLTGNFIAYLPFILAILSIIFGILGIKKAGKVMGIVGFVCSIITIIMQIVVMYSLSTHVLKGVSDSDPMSDYNSIYDSYYYINEFIW